MSKLIVILTLFTITLLEATQIGLSELNRSMYRLEITTLQDEVRVGSAVSISSDGKLVTAYHVISTAKKIKAIDVDGKTYDASVGDMSDENDLAYIYINVKNIPFAKITDKKPQWSQEVFTLNGSGLMLKGIISKVEDRGVVTNFEIHHGTSGGGLFNKNNELIAILLRVNSLKGTSYASSVEMFKVINEPFKYKDMPILETNNYDYSYCVDEEQLKIWNKLSKSTDLKVQEFHALFLGLCEKVKRKDITTEQSTVIFEDAQKRLFGK